MRIVCLALLLVGALVACSSSTEKDDVGSTSQDLGHCRTVCPNCHPNEICPLYACVQDCSGPPARCVDNQLCPIGYTWSQSACSCVPN